MAERAPSGESVATWQERLGDSTPVHEYPDFMRSEIADLRAALARRATAGTTAAPAQLESAIARVAALSKAGMELTARIVLHSPIEVNGIDYVRRDSMMDAVVDWRKAFDAAPKVERATAGTTAPDTCAEMRALCSACGGTGDVTGIDGEWRGACDCEASAWSREPVAGTTAAPSEHPARDLAHLRKNIGNAEYVESYFAAVWGIVDSLRAHIDGAGGERATAGNAAPTDTCAHCGRLPSDPEYCDWSECPAGGASALRAEPAGQHDDCYAAFDKWYEAQRHQLTNEQVCRLIWQRAWQAHERTIMAGAARQGGVTCNSGTSVLATSAAALGDLPKDLDELVREYGNAPMFGAARTRRVIMQDIYRSAGEIFASNAGAAPGWRLVPINPTPAMMDAAEACSNDWPRTTWNAAWAAMLAAAPSDTSPVGATQDNQENE
jgi:hypothetical protein